MQPISNGDFENAPTFVAATTANGVWIDGTVAGSSTNGIYGWGFGAGAQAGSWAAQFDSSQSHSGTKSIKFSTTATASNLIVGRMIANTAPGIAAGLPTAVTRTGIPYKAGFWMMTNVSSGSGTGAFLTFKTRNSSGSTVTSANSTQVSTTTGWTYYTVSITPGAASVVFDFQFTITGGTLIMSAWIDDVTLFVPGSGNFLQLM